MASNPVRFQTIEKALNLDSGSVERLSKEPGFPLEQGVGVAVLESVAAWLENRSRQDLDSTTGIDSELSAGVSPPVQAEECEQDEIVWVTIRVPIARSAPALPGLNPVPTFRINGNERHLRCVWGQLLHGCRNSHVQMRSGKHVESVASSVKYLLELIDTATRTNSKP
jgi:hypothetical protein